MPFDGSIEDRFNMGSEAIRKSSKDSSITGIT